MYSIHMHLNASKSLFSQVHHTRSTPPQGVQCPAWGRPDARLSRTVRKGSAQALTLALTSLSPHTCPIPSLRLCQLIAMATPAAQPKQSPHLPAHYFVSPLLTGSMHSPHILHRRLPVHKDHIGTKGTTGTR